MNKFGPAKKNDLNTHHTNSLSIKMKKINKKEKTRVAP